MSAPKKVFLSYSHNDTEYKDRLDTHFVSMKRNNGITTWNDRKLKAGENFNKKIAKEISEADVIIMIISADFLASSYCYDNELKVALERHKKNEALAIGVIAKDCDWKNSILKDFIVLPEDGRAIASKRGNGKEKAYVQIVEKVDEAIKAFDKAMLNTGTRRSSSIKDKTTTPKKIRRTGIKMFLPIGQDVTIQPEFFVVMSEFINELSAFKDNTLQLIEENVSQYLEYKKELEDSGNAADVDEWNYMSLQIFIQQLCRAINGAFFKYGGVRTHIRYLDFKRKAYLKLAAAYDSSEYNNDMQAIPWTGSMIYASEVHKVSLLKSLNPDLHYGKKIEESKYEDYLTFTFMDDILINKSHPILSMGISFEKSEQYKNLIYLLNYCKFDNIIIDVIKKFSRVTEIDIANTIQYNQNK